MSCMRKTLAWICRLGFVIQTSLLCLDAFYSEDTLCFQSSSKTDGRGEECKRTGEGGEGTPVCELLETYLFLTLLRKQDSLGELFFFFSFFIASAPSIHCLTHYSIDYTIKESNIG